MQRPGWPQALCLPALNHAKTCQEEGAGACSAPPCLGTFQLSLSLDKMQPALPVTSHLILPVPEGQGEMGKRAGSWSRAGALLSHELRDVGNAATSRAWALLWRMQGHCEVALRYRAQPECLCTSQIPKPPARIPRIHSEPGLEASELHTQAHVQKHFWTGRRLSAQGLLL